MNLFSGEDYVWRNSVGPEVPCPWLLHHQPHAAQQDYQGTRRWVVQSSQECIQRFWPKYVIIIYHHRSSILSSRNKITNVTGPNLEKYYSISCCWVVWWWPGASVGKISRWALAHVLRLNRENFLHGLSFSLTVFSFEPFCPQIEILKKGSAMAICSPPKGGPVSPVPSSVSRNFSGGA